MTHKHSPPDQFERISALSTDNSYIVQAPAGSGKTTLLVERYLNLLPVVERPEEILAITFTTAAAAEMKARILSSLDKDCDLTRSISSRDDQMGWKIRYNPSRLKIQTIDSFARELATQIPGVHSVSDMRSTSIAEPLYASAAQSLLGLLYSDNPAKTYIAEFLALLDNNASHAQRLLVSMLGKRDQWLELTSHLSQSAGANETQIADYLNAALQELHSNILQPLFDAASPEDQRMLLIIADHTGLAPEWEAILPLILTNSLTLRKQLSKTVNEAFLDKNFKALVANWIEELGDRGLEPVLANYHQLPKLQISNSDQDRILAVSICLSLAAIELEKIFHQQRSIDFNGVLMRAVAGLRDGEEPTDLALHWDYRIKHMLVDEFQDTSYSQYQFFSLLTEGWQPDDGNTFFAVGDPMQSIYRFRDADVSIFEQCRARGIGDIPLIPLTLTANFRSSNSLVEWNNQLFENLLPKQPMSRLGAVTFSAASPTQPDCAETQISCKYYPEETLEVAAIVAEISRLTASENPLSIGILCRARRHLPDLLKALTEADISTQGTDIFPLAKEPIIQDLMSLHCVLLRPSDRLAWFSLMRSPMIGALLTTLEFFAEESNLAQAIYERSESNVELARLHSAIHWASSKLYEYPLCEVIEGCWVRLGGMDAYAEDKIHHAMRWFELLEAQGSNGYDYEQVNTAIKELYTQTTQTAQVQVMTVHKSKGLEFDYVFLPFLSKQLVSDKASLMLWQPSADGLLVGVEGDDIHSWLKYEEKIRSENEKKRLLYVACTRAKKGLFISFSMHPDKSPIGLAKYLGDYAQEADSSTLTLKQACQSKVKSSLDNVQTQATPLYHLPRDYETKISSIELDSDLVETTSDLVDDNPASNPFELALGNLVHRALAWLGDTNAIAKGNLSSIKGINSRIQFWLEQAGVDRNYWPELKEETLKHIKITLASDQGQWILESHENAYCEWPLTGVVGNSVKHLVLDRCFESRQNIWIVDYKSSTPEGNEKQESFFASECERYRQQLTDYKTVVTALYNNDKPVRIGLFFTGLGVLKEL